MQFCYRIGHVKVVHQEMPVQLVAFSSLSIVMKLCNYLRKQIYVISHFYGICYLQRPIIK